MKKRYIFLILLIIALIVTFIYYSRPAGAPLTESQKQQALTRLLGRKVNLSNDKKADATYDDKLLSFNYPGSAVIYEYRDPSLANIKSIVGTFSYDIKIPKAVFNYVSEERPEMKSLDDDSSYRLRTLPERGYQKSAVHVSGVDGVLFKKDDPTGSERSLFILYRNTFITFSLSGESGELDRILTLLTSTLKFKQ